MKAIRRLAALGLLFLTISALLNGHDTSYSPDGDHVNPRRDNENNDEPFTYKDADRAIAQPQVMPYALAGLRFRL